MRSTQLTNEATYDQDRLDRHLWRQSQTTGLSRRELLRLMAASLGAAAAGALPCATHRAQAGTPPCIFKPTPDDLFINLSRAVVETRFEVLRHRGYRVPNDLFFVRNHTCSTLIDSDTWRLRIEGSGVEKPVDLTYDDLLSLEPVTVTRFVECAGNGRGFFATQQGQMAMGSQWHLGGIGVAEWTGARLADVLELAGLKNSAVDVMPEGLDDEFLTNGHVRRPFPIEKALEEDTLLVYGMNGEALLPDHGFPARMLVPGWVGIACIKWVGRIEVSEDPLFSPFNTTMYRLFGDDYPPEGVLLTNQNVKSAFELPFPAQLASGRHVLHGRAWSGSGRIRHVEVSIDGGHWRRARLIHPNTSTAWVRFEVEWHATPGQHVLRARATDETGQTQPDEVPFNNLGYAFWAIVDHPVEVT